MMKKRVMQTMLVAIVPLALDVIKCALTRYTYKVLRDVERRRQP
jgi:hypothetical protein